MSLVITMKKALLNLLCETEMTQKTMCFNVEGMKIENRETLKITLKKNGSKKW